MKQPTPRTLSPLHADFYQHYALQIKAKHGHPRGNSDMKFLQHVVLKPIATHLAQGNPITTVESIPFDFDLEKAFKTAQKIQDHLIEMDTEDCYLITKMKDAITEEQNKATHLHEIKSLSFLYQILNSINSDEGMAYHAERIFREVFGKTHVTAQPVVVAASEETIESN